MGHVEDNFVSSNLLWRNVLDMKILQIKLKKKYFEGQLLSKGVVYLTIRNEKKYELSLPNPLKMIAEMFLDKDDTNYIHIFKLILQIFEKNISYLYYYFEMTS